MFEPLSKHYIDLSIKNAKIKYNKQPKEVCDKIKKSHLNKLVNMSLYMLMHTYTSAMISISFFICLFIIIILSIMFTFKFWLIPSFIFCIITLNWDEYKFYYNEYEKLYEKIMKEI